jgi:putative FmdB family regulatory protein
MPTYEYACKACGEHLEVVQSFADDSLNDCPACGGPLRKVFSPIGIAFKGSGFYRTDSRAATSTKRSGSAPSSDSGSSPTEKPSTEKKPEKKPEAKRGAAAS